MIFWIILKQGPFCVIKKMRGIFHKKKTTAWDHLVPRQLPVTDVRANDGAVSHLRCWHVANIFAETAL